MGQQQCQFVWSRVSTWCHGGCCQHNREGLPVRAFLWKSSQRAVRRHHRLCRRTDCHIHPEVLFGHDRPLRPDTRLRARPPSFPKFTRFSSSFVALRRPKMAALWRNRDCDDCGKRWNNGLALLLPGGMVRATLHASRNKRPSWGEERDDVGGLAVGLEVAPSLRSGLLPLRAFFRGPPRRPRSACLRRPPEQWALPHNGSSGLDSSRTGRAARVEGRRSGFCIGKGIEVIIADIDEIIFRKRF
mmetsp:Transcript_66760/g.139379  ORF Transcript_66760/g.139379 Transcript_66760/m.139379 type:complete len:244 (+) Transcript_66760:741-1472(+)